jgi:hypothetical protein
MEWVSVRRRLRLGQYWVAVGRAADPPRGCPDGEPRLPLGEKKGSGVFGGMGQTMMENVLPPKTPDALAWLWLVAAMQLAGCGGSRTSPVEGTVLLDGKPVAGASIQFIAQGKGRDATGETDASGQFTMSTYKPRDGVLPGSYKVVIAPPTGPIDITPYASAEEAMAAASKSPPKKNSDKPSFPEKYTRPDQTPLTQDVPVGKKVVFELKGN